MVDSLSEESIYVLFLDGHISGSIFLFLIILISEDQVSNLPLPEKLAYSKNPQDLENDSDRIDHSSHQEENDEWGDFDLF